ncbi:TlpA family protein disulfide reductase [Salinilacihabitans rarus]|uniref:TlpA family protein disulfide reductase n=1 Tax=Salinilacihabitans rarus TaxID=2961596 RepID=UPI0020C89BF0|nr:redoxin domain-containing protein [Salinilacihabitans rarus]
MRRRDLLVGVGGLTAVVGVAALATRGPPGAGDGADADEDGENEDDRRTGPPFEVRTIDAPGSESGTVSLPEPGRFRLVNFARTRCPTSRATLSALAGARAAVDDADAAFLTITDPTRDPADSDERFAEWWTETDGGWPLGVDDGGVVNDHYGVGGFPTTMLLDGEGTIRWRRSGRLADHVVVEAIEAAVRG